MIPIKDFAECFEQRHYENCMRSQGDYFEGDWGIIVLCTMFLVPSSINVSIFHITWLDTFWTDLIFQNDSFPLSLLEAGGDFSPICCGNLGKLLEVNLTVLWVGVRSYGWTSLEFLSLMLVHIEPPASINYSSGFPLLALVLTTVSAPDCSRKPHLPIFTTVVCPVPSSLSQI